MKEILMMNFPLKKICDESSRKEEVEIREEDSGDEELKFFKLMGDTKRKLT